MLDPGVASFVLGALPPAPARVLEVGAGDGELALAMASAGYDVVAIDPASTADHVRTIPMHELPEAPASFDAAVAVVSLHHLEPLRDSCRRLAEVVRPGGALVLDEIDVERFDARAAGWWLEQRGPRDHDASDHGASDHGASDRGASDHAASDHGPGDHGPTTPDEIVVSLREHIHDLPTIRDALATWFELGPPTRGPYLYRWELGPDLRGPEEELIAAGRLPAVGVRIVATRTRDPA
jgi:SAM-dependent methyltransferase